MESIIISYLQMSALALNFKKKEDFGLVILLGILLSGGNVEKVRKGGREARLR